MLVIDDVSVVFNEGTINEKKGLDGISLKLNDGDFVTIIGSNGAGKSTLFNVLSGTVPSSKGKILLNDKDITLMKEYKRSCFIGRLFQDPLKGTAPSMTIAENLSLACQRGKHFSLKLFSSKERLKMKEILKILDLGLEERLDSQVKTLSGGQRQALTLLMATHMKPELLLLDEHTAALDPVTAKKVLTISSSLAKDEKMITMMITHNMEDALHYGNKTLIMKDGHIISLIDAEMKKKMTVEDLINLYSLSTHEYNDRILLAE